MLAARGERLTAFDERCIPGGCVAPPSNTAGILSRRALPAGRLARLGATPAFHHGLPAHARVAGLRRNVIALATCALGAMPPGAQAPVFHAEARLVVVDVTVQNERGEMVTSLEQRAFTVFENGARQPIAIFLGHNVPVSVGIVIDNSGSMRTRRSSVEAAALAFARESNPQDEMFVINFADTPHIDVPFTGDLRALEAGIARVDSIGGTAMRDAVNLAETYLTEHAKQDRKVLLLITDGNDNASSVPADHVRKQAGHGGIAIYAIGLPHDDPSSARHARHELDDLTEGTGGGAFHIANMNEVDTTARDLAHHIRHQYTLAYTPLNQALDGSYRTIRVAVKPSGHLSVRTRAGYFAMPVNKNGG